MKKILILMLLIIFPLNAKALTASAYIVMDTDNNRVLEGDNINKKSLIASITKIMSSMVVINNSPDLNKIITVDNNVLKSYGSGIYIEVGEKIKLIELLYGLMLRSGNDAAIELAYQIGGSMPGFTLMMNTLASSLGMKNTKFINSSGLEENDEGNISTVYDMALLSSYAIKNDIYKKIVGTKNITVKTDKKTYVWHNKNKLLTSYEYCTGGKTGFTQKARRTLVTNASKDNVNLTVVTFNDGNDFNDHHDLYEKYFNYLMNYQIVKKGSILTKVPNTYINESFNMSLAKEEYKNIKKTINYYENNATNIIGNLEVSLNGKTYFKTDIYKKDLAESKTNEKKLSWWEKFKRLVNSLW